ncbi:uncharacterized protein LOC119675871 [Teleopsis dalmanni]|uniref:uncharacterized protein LOC119675871 n=1 Tax=Teleopsis dalmanni TaxID=139649 RepID=UPI0018CF9248|nr:uncharacterized protein LOC119675871 [Teleopsis dalmanni]
MWLPYNPNLNLRFELPTKCIKKLSPEEANEKLLYALSKYEEVERKITGTPTNVHGNRILYENAEEVNIAFQYIDNTPKDIIQYCVFVLISRVGECDAIRTYCNTYLPITPRPLLDRDTIVICDGQVRRDNQVELVEQPLEGEQTELITEADIAK